jgi:hypothetical protein
VFVITVLSVVAVSDSMSTARTVLVPTRARLRKTAPLKNGETPATFAPLD